jgi:hypothetical protein
MLRRTSVVITTTGASPLIELSPVSRPTLAAPVAGHEVAELLVREGLQRGGVERLAARAQGQPDGELPHHRLAGTGRGGDQGALAAARARQPRRWKSSSSKR